MVTVESRWEVFVYKLEKNFNFVECLEIFIIFGKVQSKEQ